MKSFKELLAELERAAKYPKDGAAWIVGHWDRDEEGAFIYELIRRFKVAEEALKEISSMTWIDDLDFTKEVLSEISKPFGGEE